MKKVHKIKGEEMVRFLGEKKMDKITKGALRERGWTERMIVKFYPKPDEEVQNPRYKRAAPMKLYSEAAVLEIEATKEFTEEMEKSAIRKASAGKAIETRLKKTQDHVQRIGKIGVPRMTMEKLRKRSIRHYEDLWMERGEFREAGSSKEFLDRISVNYLKHELTRYEELLTEVYRKVGSAEARKQIKVKVLDSIAEEYPDLEVECQRQIGELDTSYNLEGLEQASVG